MVRGRQDMEEWGVSSIFKEAGVLLFKNIRILHPFILAFLLPIALILFLEVIVVAWMLAWLIVHGALRYQFDFHTFVAFSKATTDSQPLPPFVPQMLLTLSLFILTWPLLSLATAAIAKAVQHIYSQNQNQNHNNEEPNPSTAVLKPIFTSLPASFFPGILITSLWFLPLNLLAYFLLSLPFYLLSMICIPQSNPSQRLWILESFHHELCFIAFLFLDSWFRLSLQVAVLETAPVQAERNYGLVALQRSGKLAKSEVHTALGLLAVCATFYFAHLGMLGVVFRIPVYEEWPVWVMYPLAAVVSVIYVAFMAYWLVVMSVFYFVSSQGKRDGEEDLAVSEMNYNALPAS